METGSEGEINRNTNHSPTEGAKRPKRQMKTPFQLEVLEKTYAMETYPSEATRAELSEKLGLTDRQLQMWFCHRRLKDKKEAMAPAATKPRAPESVGKKGLNISPKEELMTTDPGVEPTLDSDSSSDSDSGSSQFQDRDDSPMELTRYYESPRTIMQRRAITCVELQLGEPLREDGPILGVEFDELPPGAFGAPIAELQGRYRKSYGQYEVKRMKASVDPLEVKEVKIHKDAYGGFYHSPVDGVVSKSSSLPYGNGYLLKEHTEDQPVRQRLFALSPRNNADNNEDNLHIGQKRKNNEAQVGRDTQAQKKIRKEMEKQDLLRRKREEQMRKEMERQERERRKEELRIMREQQRQQEKFEREERREMERREKIMQKEMLREERMKQKEERRREKEAARQKASLERATARRMAKESMELIEDERLELMELAASSKGLPSIVSLDYDTLQNLESFRESLCEFPPKSVQLRMPFSVQPWTDSEENVGNLLMVWKFCSTFADALGLWPFTLDEFVQAFHDYESRLLGEIHIALLKLIMKDIEDVVRTPSGGLGTNQYTAVNTEGGHPHIIEGAFSWGFDIRNWKRHLNPLTWPEILRQFALSAGLGPRLKKKSVDRASSNVKEEGKSCEEIVSTLRNGSAAENAVAIMQEKGLSLQRKSRHRLTPGTVKYAAYHVLAFEGSKGLNVNEIAEKIQKSGLRDLTSSKTPEASISVALSRDPILFERTAPSTYCVRPAFRKDPAEAESIIAAAKEKIQRYANGFLAGQNADEEDRDDDSDSDLVEAPEVDALAIPLNTIRNGEPSEVGNGKEKLPVSVALENGIFSTDVGGENRGQGVEVDESGLGEPWVQGLTEGEYSNLSIEERLNALVALIGIANEGNTLRLILEDRMDAATSLKKQMLAEAQLDKRKMKEEFINKFCDSLLNTGAECGLSPQVAKSYDPSSATVLVKDDSHPIADDISTSVDAPPTHQPNGLMTERSRLQLKSYIGHRAEELYVYKSLPLGQDRRRNRYWYFVASGSCLDPCSGRMFVESPNGCWRLIDSVESFDALLASLDTRGTRESHLHIMLQKIEACFKECVKRNRLQHHNRYGSSSDLWGPSLSFRIDIGRKETEKSDFLKRYVDLQNWMWKECLNSSNLCAMAYGKKRCSPLLGTCDTCLVTYDNSKQDICTSCQVDTKENFFDCGNNLVDWESPVRIKLIRAILALLEVSVPSEALQTSWDGDDRENWGSELQDSSSIEALLQIVTQLECPIKRNYLSEDFETTEELFGYCEPSRTDREIPWIPKTTAAVALRLLDMDASIFYTPKQRSDALDEKKNGTLPKFALRYGHTKDIMKAETMEIDRYGQTKGGKSRKIVKGSMSQLGRQKKQGRTLNHYLQRARGAPGQKLRQGPRTTRKRKLEKKVVAEASRDYFNNEDTFKNVLEEENDELRNSGRDAVDFSTKNFVLNNDSSNSMEADDSDEDNDKMYDYAKWGSGHEDDDDIVNRSNEALEMSEYEEEEDDENGDGNGYDDGNHGNLKSAMEIDDSDRDEEGSESSGDFSD